MEKESDVFSVSIPLPSFDSATIAELKKMTAGIKEASRQGPVRGGILSEGNAAAYAQVWEWGNARQTKQGPKTVKSINPDGEEVWLSIQAPSGYIRIHEPEFIEIIQQKLSAADFGDLEADEIRNGMKKASLEAAAMITEIIKETVPVDTGALRDSIGPADPDDPDLTTDDEEINTGIGFAHHVFMKNLREETI
jgi:hypothetical protein